MARLDEKYLRNFLDQGKSLMGEYLNESGSRNNLESGNTLERRDGAEVTENRNNADVVITNDDKNRALSRLSTQELVDRDNARYGNTFPQGAISSTKQTTKQKEEEKDDKPFFKPIRTKPFGKYSTRRQGGVLRYPMELMTQETDYLQIDIQKYIPLKNYISTPGTGQRYVTGNNFTNRAGRRTTPNLTTKPLINDGTILLPIPSDLKDVNSVKYDTDTLNGLQAVGAQLAEGGIEGVQKLIGTFFSKDGASERQKILDKLKAEGSTALANTIAGIGGMEAVDNFANKRFASQILGLFGGNVTASGLLARGNGEIINPNMELLFGGPTLRNFRFQFKMTPRNEKEAQQVKLIIRAFKRNMAPMAQGGTVSSGSFFLKTPNVFNLRYRTGNKNHPFLNRFKQCFLSDMSVSYTGEGIYSTYEDGTPVSMILDLSFKETQPIYDVDYDERPGTEAVGY